MEIPIRHEEISLLSSLNVLILVVLATTPTTATWWASSTAIILPISPRHVT
jgi:hypothetical protein